VPPCRAGGVGGGSAGRGAAVGGNALLCGRPQAKTNSCFCRSALKLRASGWRVHSGSHLNGGCILAAEAAAEAVQSMLKVGPPKPDAGWQGRKVICDDRGRGAPAGLNKANEGVWPLRIVVATGQARSHFSRVPGSYFQCLLPLDLPSCVQPPALVGTTTPPSAAALAHRTTSRHVCWMQPTSGSLCNAGMAASSTHTNCWQPLASLPSFTPTSTRHCLSFNWVPGHRSPQPPSWAFSLQSEAHFCTIWVP
jgi:hypothetical protein